MRYGYITHTRSKLACPNSPNMLSNSCVLVLRLCYRALRQASENDNILNQKCRTSERDSEVHEEGRRLYMLIFYWLNTKRPLIRPPRSDMHAPHAQSQQSLVRSQRDTIPFNPVAIHRLCHTIV